MSVQTKGPDEARRMQDAGFLRITRAPADARRLSRMADSAVRPVSASSVGCPTTRQSRLRAKTMAKMMAAQRPAEAPTIRPRRAHPGHRRGAGSVSGSSCGQPRTTRHPRRHAASSWRTDPENPACDIAAPSARVPCPAQSPRVLPRSGTGQTSNAQRIHLVLEKCAETGENPVDDNLAVLT